MHNFEDYLNEIVGRIGLGTLADQLEIDPAALSRFRSGQGSLPLSAIDKILRAGNVAIVRREEWRKVEDALEVMSDLWKRERGSNHKNGKQE